MEFLPNDGNPYLSPHDHQYDLRPRTLGPASALVPWWRLGLGGFTGTARYRCTFIAPAAPAGRCWIDLGRVEQAAEASLNGRPLGSRLWRPFRFEATGMLAEGQNQLEVLVTNGTANFLTAPRGDQPPPLTQLPVSAMWSGLLGPVCLLAEGEGEPGGGEQRLAGVAGRGQPAGRDRGQPDQGEREQRAEPGERVSAPAR